MTRGFPYDVVIVGGGLAGLTAAYTLSESRVLLLERSAEVGGRVKSGTWNDVWYDVGAQYLYDARLLNIAHSLGLRSVSARGGKTGIYYRGKYVQVGGPLDALWHLPMSAGAKLSLVKTYLRLLPKLRRLNKGERGNLDDVTLAALLGPMHPEAYQLFDTVAVASGGLRADQISALVGLPYVLNLILSADGVAALRKIEGGNQRVATALADAISGEIQSQASVTRVRNIEGGVEVSYRRGDEERTIAANIALMACPAPQVLETVEGLTGEKVPALRAVQAEEVGDSLVAAFQFRRPAPAPWDGMYFTIGIGSRVEFIGNNSFFAHKLSPRQSDSLTVGGAGGIDALQEELFRIFPGARDRLQEVMIQQWHTSQARFGPGSRRTVQVLREPLGAIYFCGDYTNSPGTEGAVGSGYHVAQKIAERQGHPCRELPKEAPEPSA